MEIAIGVFNRKEIAVRLSTWLSFFPALVFMVAYAWGQDVHYNYDRGANFGSYKTYRWVDLQSGPPKADASTGLPNPPAGLPELPIGRPPVGSTVSDDQLLDQDIKRAVDEQLAQKGLTKVDKNGDLLVGYQAAVDQEKSINLFGSGWGGGPGGGGWGGWGGGFSDMSVQGQTSSIQVGTLVVGIYDPARKQLIWRGDATKTVAPKKDPNKNYQTLEKAMAKLFKNYPPQPGK